jgi:hypothetical protein
MPQKDIDRNSIIFKELGTLQEKVVFFLAENPENHKQAIQKGIGHPPDQYASVQKAVANLEKSGYIQSKEVLSQKKVTIKSYSCTELGVFYALSRNPNPNITRIFDSYETKVDLCKQLRPLYEVWGQEQFFILLKNVGEILPIVKNHGVEYAAPYLIMKSYEQMKSLDKKTKERNVKETLKQFPETKAMLKEMHKNLDDILLHSG